MAISNELRKLVNPNNECCCEHCLGNKCKEWAFKKGYFIQSGIIPFGSKMAIVSYKLNGEVYRIKTDEEQESIFKACEWILENLKD